MRQHRRDAGRLGADQQHRAGGGDLGEERGGVERAVQQHQHARLAAAAAAAAPGSASSRSVARARARRRADHGCRSRPASSAAAWGSRRSPSDSGSGPASDRLRSVSGTFSELQPVEGDRAQPAEHGSRGARAGQRPGHHLEQRLQRGRARAGGADPAAPSPTVAAPPGRPARRSACPTPGRSPAAGTAPAPARSTPRPARAGHAAAAAPCGSGRGRHRPARTADSGSARPDGPGANTPAATVTVRVIVAVADVGAGVGCGQAGSSCQTAAGNGASEGVGEDREGSDPPTRGPVAFLITTPRPSPMIAQRRARAPRTHPD